MRKALALALALLPLGSVAQAGERRLPYLAGIGMFECANMLEERPPEDIRLLRAFLVSWTEGFVTAQNVFNSEGSKVVIATDQIDSEALVTHLFRYCRKHGDKRILLGVIDYLNTLDHYQG